TARGQHLSVPPFLPPQIRATIREQPAGCRAPPLSGQTRSPGVLPGSPILPDPHTSRDDSGASLQLLRTLAAYLEHTAGLSPAVGIVLPHSFPPSRPAICPLGVKADQAPRAVQSCYPRK